MRSERFSEIDAPNAYGKQFCMLKKWPYWFNTPDGLNKNANLATYKMMELVRDISTCVYHKDSCKNNQIED